MEMMWPGIEPEQRMNFRGDALELLTEYLMKVLSLAHNQGVLNYKPVKRKEDYGVDATGIKNEIQVVLQCKFRNNPLILVPYSDLARTFTQGVIQFGLDPKAKKNLWLITTAQDANKNAKTILGKNLHILNREHLGVQVNGNVDFWKGFLASI
jgi:hypothetical protein